MWQGSLIQLLKFLRNRISRVVYFVQFTGELNKYLDFLAIDTPFCRQWVTTAQSLPINCNNVYFLTGLGFAPYRQVLHRTTFLLFYKTSLNINCHFFVKKKKQSLNLKVLQTIASALGIGSPIMVLTWAKKAVSKRALATNQTPSDPLPSSDTGFYSSNIFRRFHWW